MWPFFAFCPTLLQFKQESKSNQTYTGSHMDWFLGTSRLGWLLHIPLPSWNPGLSRIRLKSFFPWRHWTVWRWLSLIYSVLLLGPFLEAAVPRFNIAWQLNSVVSSPSFPCVLSPQIIKSLEHRDCLLYYLCAYPAPGRFLNRLNICGDFFFLTHTFNFEHTMWALLAASPEVFYKRPKFSPSSLFWIEKNLKNSKWDEGHEYSHTWWIKWGAVMVWQPLIWKDELFWAQPVTDS